MPVSKNRRKSSAAQRRKKNRMERGIYNYPKVRPGVSPTPEHPNPLTELLDPVSLQHLR